jgi:hypothetical protein
VEVDMPKRMPDIAPVEEDICRALAGDVFPIPTFPLLAINKLLVASLIFDELPLHTNPFVKAALRFEVDKLVIVALVIVELVCIVLVAFRFTKLAPIALVVVALDVLALDVMKFEDVPKRVVILAETAVKVFMKAVRKEAI